MDNFCFIVYKWCCAINMHVVHIFYAHFKCPQTVCDAQMISIKMLQMRKNKKAVFKKINMKRVFR